MRIIKETYLLTATTADVLEAPSRLAAIPANGVMTLELSATDCDTTNYATTTIQLPDGSNPVQDVHIPYNGVSTADVAMKDDCELQFQFSVAKGGHLLLSITEAGTVAGVLVIATLSYQ